MSLLQIVSLFKSNILNISIKILMFYCLIMVPINFYGSYCYTKLMDPVPNVLYFKKDQLVHIDNGMLATLFYTEFMLVIYFFSGKYINPEILDKNSKSI